MQNSDITKIWDELQIVSYDPNHKIQRIVYLGLLFRAYVGLKSIPKKKYLILELPLKYSDEFKGFKETKGLELSVYRSGSEKTGFISCELTSSSSEMNDIFTIVCQDILNELKYCFSRQIY